MLNKNLKILTVGGAVQDITLHTNEGVIVDNAQNLIQQKLVGFELGAKINIKNAEFTYGGGATNSAIGLAKLGNVVYTLICISEDAIGNEILKNLKENKVKIDLVQKSNLSSGMSIVLKGNNFNQEHILFTYRGSNENLDLTRLGSLSGLYRSGGHVSAVDFDLIYLTSLSNKKFKNNLTQVFKFKRESSKLPMMKNKTIRLAWNPGNLQIKMGLSGLKPYLKETDIFIVNKDEAIEICIEFKNKIRLNNIRELLKILANYCPGVIVITNQRKGAYALGQRTLRGQNFKNRKIYYQESCNIKVEDTTGVGDAFGATFSWALLTTDYDIQKSLQLAINNACSVLKQTGAQNGLCSLGKLLVTKI